MVETFPRQTQQEGFLSSEQRVSGLLRRVENSVLAPYANTELPDVAAAFTGLAPKEKADLLHEKLTAYLTTRFAIREEKRTNPEQTPEPVDPYLVSEIKTLWEDQEAQKLFANSYAESRMDHLFYRDSETGRNYKEITQDTTDTKKAYEGEARQLFLQKVTRPDQVTAARGRTARLAKELIRLDQERQDIISLKGKDQTAENTDIAAEIMYQTIEGYHDQGKQGFMWLPSRVKIHVATVESLTNGRWPSLRGEAGTGKSEQADAAALVVTGEQPTHIACTKNTSERDLIADKDIDPATGGSYETYGPAMQAATGYESSLDKEPKFHTGRIVRYDESGRMGEKGYSATKEFRQKRPATPQDIRDFKEGRSIDPDKLLHGKPVLPGFGAVLTTNPEGPRYPDRTEPDAALRRELSYITVDYPDQNATNPETFEAMLGALMDDNHHISAIRAELSPAYTVVSVDEQLSDGRKVKARQELVADPTDPHHGALYRLAFAVRALQDAFNNGNSTSISENALRFNINTNGQVEIVRTGGDPLTLSNTTITLGEVRSWMEGFKDRMLKDDPAYHVHSMTEWIQLKLNTFLNQVDDIDKDKAKAIFSHFHLFDKPGETLMRDATPLTSKQIGYLSPRVPRPLHLDLLTKPQGEASLQAPQVSETVKRPEVYQDKQAMLEDGTTILVSSKAISLNIQEDNS